MELQTYLDRLEDGKIKIKTAELGMLAINHRWLPNTKHAVRSSSAYYIDDGLTIDSRIHPSLKFDEIVLKGRVPKLSCISVNNRLLLSLPFFDAVVLGPMQELEPELVDYEMEGHQTVLPIGVPISRPIFTPVEDVKFIMLAA